MDIDCDGDQSDQDDGRCGNSADTQFTTPLKSLVQQYSQILVKCVSDLNANYNPYVVLDNSADSGKCTPYPPFNPQDYGVKPLIVMAVICNNHMFYGV
ncbi:glycoside hydrolase family 75 [Lecanosticta acicola]|uniref:Endo-chitosanase n=1 Tax=Lecanosticta acicola TaxID=111012 RepID=A0AAI8Z1A5_9PEZI|nr:glycoside hydrolase family 75 [Lecanosticta acicola]